MRSSARSTPGAPFHRAVVTPDAEITSGILRPHLRSRALSTRLRDLRAMADRSIPHSPPPNPTDPEQTFGNSKANLQIGVQSNQTNSFQDIGISRQRYEVDNAVWGWDVEKISAPGAGYNMAHGQLLRVRFAGVGDSVDSHHATKVYVALHQIVS